MAQHAGSKWLIHDTQRRKDNQLQSLGLHWVREVMAMCRQARGRWQSPERCRNMSSLKNNVLSNDNLGNYLFATNVELYGITLQHQIR